MQCMNCGQQLPPDAKVCAACEAPVEPEMSAEDLKLARAVLDNMPPDALAELMALAEDSESAEDFADRIFVGDCPECGSEDTGNCESDPEIGELLVGRCYQCGHLWCTECGKTMSLAAHQCPCWDEEFDEFDELEDDEELDNGA